MPISDATLILTALEEYFRRQEGKSSPCGKTPYTSAEAKRAIRALKLRRRGKRTAERQSYKCRHCGFYHLTSHPR